MAVLSPNSDALGMHGGEEANLLASCYPRSLELIVELGCHSIAFPLISAGAYGYLIEDASRVALTAIRDFVRPNPTALDLIELTTFSAREHQTYQRAYREIFSGSEASQG